MTTFIDEGDPHAPVVYDHTWIVNDRHQPTDSVIIGFELDEDYHCTIVVTPQAAQALTCQLLAHQPWGVGENGPCMVFSGTLAAGGANK